VRKNSSIDTEKTKTAEAIAGSSITNVGGANIPLLDLSTISNKSKKDASRFIEKEKEYFKE